jgi:hypothetical protein
MDTCEYHGRKGCKACTALKFALKAEAVDKPAMAESQFAKAIDFEARGE